MFRVILLAAILTLSAADFEPVNELDYRQQGPGQPDPNQIFGLVGALWKMLTDKSGYVQTLEAGKATGTCEETDVKITYIEGPSVYKPYGLYNSKIEYLSVSHKDKKPGEGLVKLWIGGVGKPFVILEFKSPGPKKNSDFIVKMCW